MKKLLKKWIYKQAKKVIARRLIKDCNVLTPEYLLAKGWIEKDGYFVEPNIKDRDRVSIKFEHHYYRVWHSSDRTFIALRTSLDWLEMYMLFIHNDGKLYDLAGV